MIFTKKYCVVAIVMSYGTAGSHALCVTLTAAVCHLFKGPSRGPRYQPTSQVVLRSASN